LCGEHVNDAVGLLKKYGSEAKWLSGGMSLIPQMKLRLAGPTHLIDLYRWRHLLLQAAHSHRSAGVTRTAVRVIVNPATAPPELDVPSIDVRRERRKK
jgi:carbon-monoxide dehydrogenase medium subunit